MLAFFALALPVLASERPPILVDLGEDALVSAIAITGTPATTGGMSADIAHVNPFWGSEGGHSLCVTQKAGSTTQPMTFQVLPADADGKPDTANPIWTSAPVSSSGVGLVCGAFSTGTQHQSSYFTSNVLTVPDGELVYFVAERDGSTGTITGTLTYEHVNEGTAGALVRRAPAGGGAPTAPIRGFIEVVVSGNSTLQPQSSGMALIYLRATP